MKLNQRLTRAALTICFVVIGSMLCCSQVVGYAGFCFSGNYSDVPANYKYTHQIIQAKDGPQSSLDKLFADYFRSNSQFGNFELAVNSQDSNKLSLAVALNREDVSLEYFGDQTKAIFSLGCTIFIMSFSDLAIIQSYPITVTYVDMYPAQPSEDQLRECFLMLYREQILGKLQANQARIMLGTSNSCTIKVANVLFTSELEEHLAANQIDQDSYGRALAQHLTEMLAFRMNLTVLPYSKGSLTQKMSLSFSDASVQNFSIPQSSYDIDLTVKRFLKQPYAEEEWEKVDLYGTRLELRIYDAEFGNEYWKNDITHAEAKRRIEGQVIASDHNVFNEVLLIAMQTKLPDTLSNDKKLMKGVLQKCANY